MWNGYDAHEHRLHHVFGAADAVLQTVTEVVHAKSKAFFSAESRVFVRLMLVLIAAQPRDVANA
jgi:hypothetical protein